MHASLGRLRWLAECKFEQGEKSSFVSGKTSKRVINMCDLVI